MTRVYLDTNVFVYAVGQDSPYREPCRDILRAVVSSSMTGETSVYTLQEVARQRSRRGDEHATARARDVASLCSVVHPVDRRVGMSALDVVDQYPKLDISDAVHVATAFAHGIATVVSADADLDAIAGIQRVDPLDGARVAALTSE